MTNKEIKELAKQMAEEFWKCNTTVSEEIATIKAATNDKKEFRKLWNAVFKELQYK